MGEILTGVNWIAVIIATLICFFVGWLWYSPLLFGTTWATGNKIDLNSMEGMPIAPLIWQVAGLFLLSWFVGVLATSNALWTLILGAAAFTVLKYSAGMFSQQPGEVRLIDSGHWIALVAIMVICQHLVNALLG